MNVIFEHNVWIDIQHMTYLALFRNDQQNFQETLRNNAFQQTLIKFLVALR